MARPVFVHGFWGRENDGFRDTCFRDSVES
jgi:hypothetical protein